MEEGNRCNVRKYTGGRALQQVVNYTTVGGRPETSATHILRQEHRQTGQE
jgi:hypothetical protein